MTVVVNFYGGPCTGKTTLAHAVAACLSMEAHRVVAPTEPSLMAYLDGKDPREVGHARLVEATRDLIRGARDRGYDFVLIDQAFLNLAVYATWNNDETGRRDALYNHDQMNQWCQAVHVQLPKPKQEQWQQTGRVGNHARAAAIHRDITDLMQELAIPFHWAEPTDKYANQLASILAPSLEDP